MLVEARADCARNFATDGIWQDDKSIHNRDLARCVVTDEKFASAEKTDLKYTEAGTRSEDEGRMTSERQSRLERQPIVSGQPSKEQLSLFAKRVRRAIRDENSRHIFGVPSGDDFQGYPDVRRTLDWIESLANS